MLPCTVSVAVLLSLFMTFPTALHNILVLLYSDDTVTDRFLLITCISNVSVSNCSNFLLVIAIDVAVVSLTLYSILLVLPLAVQVNSTVLPSTAAIDVG